MNTLSVCCIWNLVAYNQSGLCHKKRNAQNPIGGPASNVVKKLMQLDILSINFRSLVARQMVVLAKPNLL